MKTKEELNALKEEVVTLNEKLHELTDKELEQVSGGVTITGDIVTPSTKIKKPLSPHKEKNPREKPTPEFVICPNCGGTILPRQACPDCGFPDVE